jgi:hypothetical protein
MSISWWNKRTAMLKARRMSLVVAVLLAVITAVPLQASAAGPVPFQATLTESVVSTAPCPGLPSQYICVTVTGSGRATHLGAVTESMVVTVDTVTASSLAPDCHVENRTSTLTAANGNQITLQGPGIDCGVDTAQGSAVDFWTVTGGTGRFYGATGSGTNRVTINELTVPVTSVTVFSGTLSP